MTSPWLCNLARYKQLCLPIDLICKVPRIALILVQNIKPIGIFVPLMLEPMTLMLQSMSLTIEALTLELGDHVHMEVRETSKVSKVSSKCRMNAFPF